MEALEILKDAGLANKSKPGKMELILLVLFLKTWIRKAITAIPIIKINSYYRNNLDYVDKYNKVLREVAKKFKIELCDLGNLEEHLVDGVHFGNAGYKAIAQLWTKSILKQQK